MTPRFSDPETHYRTVRSHTPVSVDGFALGEVVEWECDGCGARAAHIDGIEAVHWPWCEQAVETDTTHGPGFDGTPHR